MTTTVGIQGIRGSFHHIALKQYFKSEVDIKECLSFDGLVECLLTNECDTAIMAIENSIVGSILSNYTLIDDNHLYIVGECFLDIQHHLLALPNQNISDLKEVYSHPMALQQCKHFFKSYKHIRLIEDKDTAEVAQKIRVNNLKNIGAIASEMAAKIYKLNTLAQSIQTIKHNQTRFAVLKTSPLNPSDNEINKASIKFELNHKRGSLATLLNVLSDCKLNLTKIQSLPKSDTPWKYLFFVDITFNHYSDYKKAIAIITIMAQDFKILGIYNKGTHD